MTKERWFLVIPPDGAARITAQHTANALLLRLGNENFKSIDTATIMGGYKNLLKTQDTDMSTDLFNQTLAVSCLDFGSTRLLVTALSPVTLFTLRLLKRQNITTVLWFYENCRKVEYWRSVIKGYDHLFAIQHGEIEESCRIHSVAYHFLPTASGCAEIRYQPKERIYDSVFIGIPSTYRIAVLEAVAKRGLTIAVAGYGWQHYTGTILKPMIKNSGWVNDEEAFLLMQQGKTGINLSVEDPRGRPDVHISPRIYDILAAGCIALSEEQPLLSESLPECTVYRFNTMDEAAERSVDLCRRYDQKNDIIRKNRAAVINHHRYLNRVDTLCALVDNY